MITQNTLLNQNDETITKCAPHLEFKDGSCIPLNILVNMADAYNKYNNRQKNNNQIKLNPELENSTPNEYKRYLLNEFNDRFSGNQKQWINNKYIELMNQELKEELENNVFRPDGPQGRFEWLSTLDINAVLSQYENKYKDFKFLGAVPIDFMNLKYLPFKTLKFEELENEGYTKIGVIFNTDKSYESGQHWISLFTDLGNGRIYFSDSVGDNPPHEVEQYMGIIKQYLQSKNISNIDMQYNKTPHQKGSTECGVYSINFILRLLKGKSFEHITRKRLTDDKINKCRLRYFGNKIK